MNKKSIQLSEIISKYIKLKKDGDLYKGHCPFCPSQKMTFYVDDKKSIYYCSKDGSIGDSILFIMRLKNISYENAIEILNTSW